MGIGEVAIEGTDSNDRRDGGEDGTMVGDLVKLTTVGAQVGSIVGSKVGS